MIKESFFLAVATLLSASLYAQYNPANQYVPPSPNSSALAKFVDIPVNIHTGVPQVGIPIYSWKNDISGLSLDVSLSYHAGGVKVEEIASNVGLGWSLNAGGVITRTMRGQPDEGGFGFLSQPVLPNLYTGVYDGEFLTSQTTNAFQAVNSTNNPTYIQTVLDIEANLTDGLQDIFYYNFNGKSGKFFIGKNGSILIQSLDNLKINPVQTGGNKITYFEVIDEQGRLYIFKDTELTTSTGHSGLNQSPPIEYVSSWYLSEIKSADRQTSIFFDYESSFHSYNTGFSESKSYNYNTDFLSGSAPGTLNSHTASYNAIQLFGVSIKKIRFPDGTFVEFTYENAYRSDLNGSHALKRITIGEGTSNYGFNLEQGYQDARLKLLKLNKFAGMEVERPYQFFYHTGLPSYDSMSQDYWGYAVGAQRNITSRISSILSLGDRSDDVFLEGSDRRPDAQAVKYGSLARIVYPTGGSTVYEMECNDAFDQTNYFVNKQQLNILNFYKGNLNTPQSIGFENVLDNKIDFRIEVVETSRLTPQPGEPVWWIEGEEDNTPVSIILRNGAGTWSQLLYSGTYGQVRSATGITVNGVTVPSSGNYYLDFQANTATLYPVEFSAQIIPNVYIQPQDKLVGGLRVKRILNYLDSNELVLASVKSFSYLDNNNLSSGKLSVVPNFNYYKSSLVQWYNCGWPSGPGTLQLINRSSESTQPLGSVQGSPVGYSRVTVAEMDGNNAINGKTVYQFSSLTNFGSYHVYPFLSGEYINWGAGLPLKEEIYNASGVLLKKVENDYSVSVDKFENNNHRSLKVGLIYKDNCNTVSLKQFAVLPEYPIYGNSLKQWQKETTYENGAAIVSEQSYTYDLMHQTKTITQQTSDGSIKTKLYYPYDFTGLWQFNQLVAENRIANAVKTELWRLDGGVEQSLISGEATDFTNFGSALRASATYQVKAAGYAPIAHHSSQLLPAGSYRVKEAIHAYNGKGAPLTVSAFEGPKSGLLWQPDGLRLKALFGNADASEIYVADFETNGNYAIGHTGGLSYNGNFTLSFVPPNGKNYVLNYWSWNGSKWNLVSQAYSPSMSISGIIDDVMIYPSDALPLKSFTYFPLFGVRDILEPAQLQRFEYDVYGRLMSLKDRFGDLVKAYDYHYKP